jgi:hypothetical protein
MSRYPARQRLGQSFSKAAIGIDQAMNRHVNAIAGRLSLNAFSQLYSITKAIDGSNQPKVSFIFSINPEPIALNTSRIS